MHGSGMCKGGSEKRYSRNQAELRLRRTDAKEQLAVVMICSSCVGIVCSVLQRHAIGTLLECLSSQTFHSSCRNLLQPLERGVPSGNF